MKMNLQTKFLLPMAAVLLAGMALLTIISYRITSQSLNEVMVQQIERLSVDTARLISEWTAERKREVRNWAGTKMFVTASEDSFVGKSARQSANAYMAEVQKEYGYYETINIANASGVVVAASTDKAIGLDISGRVYFKEAMTGKPFISSVLKSKLSGNPVFMVANPIEKDGNIIGVFFVVVNLGKFAEENITSVTIGKTGYAFMYDQSGVVVAHPDPKLVLDVNLAEHDWGKAMLEKGTGMLTYSYEGVEKIVAFTKDDNTGWTIVVSAITDEIYGAARRIGYWTVGMALALVVLIGVVMALMMRGVITGPLQKAADLADAVAAGDLSQRLSMKSGDEVGKLADALDTMADSLRAKADLTETIASGDFTRKVEMASDKDVLGHALKAMVDNLSKVIGQVRNAAAKVDAGAGQVSASSQALSQGATEQAASLEEISSSMTEIGSQTKTNAENATQAAQLAQTSQTGARQGNEQMGRMIEAMTRINDSSREISKIIKTIDDIAFQTNLLALNAAVEAARAGKHGKGFAVVAQEVRNLAGRSAKAAMETADLIEGSIKRVDNGVAIANETAKFLEEIVSGATQATDLVGEIAAASNEQAMGISQVNQGLGQIEKVTQQNTANAEETASAAEELSSQATILTGLLRRFKLSSREAAGAPAGDRRRKEPGAALPGPETGKIAHAPKGWDETPQLVKDDRMVRPEDEIALDDDEFGRY